MNHFGTLTGLQSMSHRQGSTANWPHGIWAPNPRATRAVQLDTSTPRKAHGRKALAKPKIGPPDWRNALPVTSGLGVAGTHGPEGQAAFSCGRPVNRHVNRSRRRERRRGLSFLL
jgi:hypothetical protein